MKCNLYGRCEGCAGDIYHRLTEPMKSNDRFIRPAEYWMKQRTQGDWLAAMMKFVSEIEALDLTPEKIKEMLAERDSAQKALKLMSEYLGEAVECPAASIGDALWPECNGEAEACGDNRTVGECWLRYFVEKAQEESHGQTDSTN